MVGVETNGVFMRGNILAVDFENKKLLKETQHKSETKTNKHYLNHTEVCDGGVTLFTTKKSADELAENGFTSINYHNNKKLAEIVLEQIEGKVAKEF